MTEQTDAAEALAYALALIQYNGRAHLAEHDLPNWRPFADGLLESDWLADREAAARAEALRGAAEDCHDEARWCEEQEMRGKPQNAVDRVLVLEKVFRQRSQSIARTDGAGS